MYGVESATGGQLGGLAAQVPGGDLYFPQAAGIQNVQSAVAGSPAATGVTLPWSAQGETQTPTAYTSLSAPAVPMSQQHSNWSTILDFHNSPAPWILLGVLVLYGWLHLTATAKAGPAKVSAVL